MSCYNCEYYDKEHADMYGEDICTLADEVIRLKQGQHIPKWCPTKQYEKEVSKLYKPTGHNISEYT